MRAGSLIVVPQELFLAAEDERAALLKTLRLARRQPRLPLRQHVREVGGAVRGEAVEDGQRRLRAEEGALDAAVEPKRVVRGVLRVGVQVLRGKARVFAELDGALPRADGAEK